MKTLRLTRIYGTIILAAGAAVPWRSAQAADSAALLRQAMSNTNHVKTLVYTSETNQKTKTLSVQILIRGEEDEVHNRERDHEEIVLSGKNPSGQPATARYVADVVFLNGKTYYRRTVDHGKWHTKNGMTFQDPNERVVAFKRGRTKVSFPSVAHFSPVSSNAPNGETRYHAAYTYKGAAVVEDVYVSGGSTPFVVEDDLSAPFRQAGQTIQSRTVTKYGPFNQTLVIEPPTQSATT
jgi:hypothetical protein